MENMAGIGYEVTDEHRKKSERLAISVYNIFTLYGLMGKNKKRYVGFMSVVSQMPGFNMIVKLLMKKPFKLYDFDDSGDWSLDEYVQIFCEPIGISEEDGTKLGRRYGQYAIVVGELGGPAKLIDCRRSPE